MAASDQSLARGGEDSRGTIGLQCEASGCGLGLRSLGLSDSIIETFTGSKRRGAEVGCPLGSAGTLPVEVSPGLEVPQECSASYPLSESRDTVSD